METGRATPLFGFLILAIGLQGCSKLYVHQDSREELAKEALSAFDKAVSADLFNHAIEELENDLIVQRQAAQHMITAAQDLQLAALIEGQDVATMQVGKRNRSDRPLNS